MSLEELIAEALAATSETPPTQPDAGATEPTPQPAGTTPDRLSALTPHEWEVLALLAQGATNRAIADALVIAERTAELHVRNILGKLGVTSSTQAAAYALAHGLALPHDA